MNAHSKNTKTVAVKNNAASDLLIWKDRSKTALMALAKAVAGDVPVIALTGDAGSGKSTFLASVSEHLGIPTQITRMSSNTRIASELEQQFIQKLSLSVPDASRKSFLAAIRKQLFDVDSAGKTSLFLIDDANAFADDALDLIISIAGIARKNRFLARFILSGTSLLHDRLDALSADKDGTLVEAISVPALTRAASFELMQSQMALISGETCSIDEKACATVYRETNGAPAITKELIARIYQAAQTRKISTVDLRNVRELMVEDGQSSKPKIVESRIRPGAGSAQAKTSKKLDEGDVGTPDQLPKSIREVDDPKQLLRWAMGVNAEDKAAKPAQAPAAAKPQIQQPAKKIEVEVKGKPPGGKKGNITLPFGSSVPASAPQSEPPQQPAPQPAAPQTAHTQRLSSSEQFVFADDSTVVPERGYVGAAQEDVADTPSAEPETYVPAHVVQAKEGNGFLKGALTGVALAALVAAGGYYWISQNPPGGSTELTADPITEPYDPIVNLADGFGSSATNIDANTTFRLQPVQDTSLALRQPEFPVATQPQSVENAPLIAAVETDLQIGSLEQVLNEGEAAKLATAQAQTDLQDLRTQIAELNAARDALRTQTSDAQAAFDAATQRLQAAQADLLETENRVATAKSELEQTKLSTQNFVDTQSLSVAEASERLGVLNTAIVEREGALEQTRLLLDTLSSDVETAREQAAGLSAEIETKTQSLAEQSARLDTLIAQRTIAESEFAQSQANLANTTEELTLATQLVTTAQANFARVQNALETTTAQQAAAAEATETLVKERRALETQIAGLQEQRETLRGDTTQLESDLAALQSRIEDRTQTATALDSELPQRAAQRDAIISELEALEQAKADRTAEIAALESRATDLETQIQTFAPAFVTASTRLTDLDAELSGKSQELADGAIEAAALRAEIDELLARAQTARSLLSTTQEQLGASAERLDGIEQQIEIALANAPENAAISPPPARATTATNDPNIQAALEDVATSAIDSAEIARTRPAANLIGRDRVVVAKALERAPGLSELSSSQRASLENQMVRGVCLTDALQDVTGQINRHTLAVLLKTMKLCTNG